MPRWKPKWFKGPSDLCEARSSIEFAFQPQFTCGSVFSRRCRVPTEEKREDGRQKGRRDNRQPTTDKQHQKQQARRQWSGQQNTISYLAYVFCVCVPNSFMRSQPQNMVIALQSANLNLQSCFTCQASNGSTRFWVPRYQSVSRVHKRKTENPRVLFDL